MSGYTEGLLEVLPASEASNSFIVASAETGRSVADCFCPIEGKSEANARRLVACWNACAGLTTEEIEGIPVPIDRLARDYRSIRNQRDELLVALNDCLEWMESLRASGDAGNWDWKDDEYTKGVSAIAKVRG